MASSYSFQCSFLLYLSSNSSAGTPLNILCIPSRCRSCPIWSDPAGWRRWWGGWQGETQAAICTQGPVMEGPNTSRSALTGTSTLPGSKAQEKLFAERVVTSVSLLHRLKRNLLSAWWMIFRVKSRGGVSDNFQIIFYSSTKTKC